MTRSEAAAELAAAGVGPDAADAMLNVAEQLGELNTWRLDPPAAIGIMCIAVSDGPHFYVAVATP